MSSDEYQCSERWRRLLDSLAALDLLGWRGNLAQFVAELRRTSAATEFKPESLGAPVQIMDAQEARGSAFDALWVGSCSAQLWPAVESAPPLLPLGMLAEAGFPLPGSDAAEDCALGATARLLSAAPDVVLSLALRGEDDGEQSWAPVFAAHPAATPPAPRPALVESFAGAELEALADRDAPPLAAGENVRGGTGLIADQSNCPFRAFAIRRLQAAEPRGPNDALTPMERGQLVELALQRLWEELESSEGLQRLEAAARDAAIARATDAALDELMPATGDAWQARFRQLERRRTLALLAEWLDVEAARAPFRVVAHQEEVELSLAGLTLHGRVDRVDEAAGSSIVIDYKTGKVNTGDWKVPRPAAPQLPLYVLALRARQQKVAGAAFAQLRKGECGFRAYTSSHELLPGGDGSRAFGAEFDEYAWLWQMELEQIAAGFVRGEAAVDPRIDYGRSGSPCERCHLEQLCRVSEAGEADEDEEVSDE